jgi:hypothetical protein
LVSSTALVGDIPLRALEEEAVMQLSLYQLNYINSRCFTEENRIFRNNLEPLGWNRIDMSLYSNSWWQYDLAFIAPWVQPCNTDGASNGMYIFVITPSWK